MSRLGRPLLSWQFGCKVPERANKRVEYETNPIYLKLFVEPQPRFWLSRTSSQVDLKVGMVTA